MTFENEETRKATIIKVEGRPNSPSRTTETTRWQRFKHWFFPSLRKSKELAEAYAEAKVETEKSSARKTTEEAAEIAARKDLTRLKGVKKYNEIVDDIFADDGLSQDGKLLKLAKLMETNPQVSAQLAKVKDLIEKLALTKGVSIEVVDEPQKALTEAKKEKEEDVV